MHLTSQTTNNKWAYQRFHETQRFKPVPFLLSFLKRKRGSFKSITNINKKIARESDFWDPLLQNSWIHTGF